MELLLLILAFFCPLIFFLFFFLNNYFLVWYVLLIRINGQTVLFEKILTLCFLVSKGVRDNVPILVQKILFLFLRLLNYFFLLFLEGVVSVVFGQIYRALFSRHNYGFWLLFFFLLHNDFFLFTILKLLFVIFSVCHFLLFFFFFNNYLCALTLILVLGFCLVLTLSWPLLVAYWFFKRFLFFPLCLRLWRIGPQHYNSSSINNCVFLFFFFLYLEYFVHLLMFIVKHLISVGRFVFLRCVLAPRFFLCLISSFCLFLVVEVKQFLQFIIFAWALKRIFISAIGWKLEAPLELYLVFFVRWIWLINRHYVSLALIFIILTRSVVHQSWRRCLPPLGVFFANLRVVFRVDILDYCLCWLFLWACLNIVRGWLKVRQLSKVKSRYLLFVLIMRACLVYFGWKRRLLLGRGIARSQYNVIQCLFFLNVRCLFIVNIAICLLNLMAVNLTATKSVTVMVGGCLIIDISFSVTILFYIC